MRHRYAIFALLLYSCIVLSGTKSDNCLDYIQDYVRKMGQMNTPTTNDKCYFMDMEYVVTPNPKLNAQKSAVNSHVIITRAKGYYGYQSKELEVYADNDELIQIIHVRKQIIRSNIVDIETLEMENKNRLNEFQQQMLEKATVLKCSENAKKENTIDVRINPSVSETLKIRYVSYLYDITSESVKTVTIYYKPDQVVSSLKTIYHRIDFDYKWKKPDSIQKLIFQNNKLLPKYAGYLLLDNRNKK